MKMPWVFVNGAFLGEEMDKHRQLENEASTGRKVARAGCFPLMLELARFYVEDRPGFPPDGFWEEAQRVAALRTDVMVLVPGWHHSDRCIEAARRYSTDGRLYFEAEHRAGRIELPDSFHDWRREWRG